jgi:5'-methylthioadenosine phosphorylase
MIKIGLIIGYGIHLREKLTNITEHTIETPYGKPSSTIISGQLENNKEVFLLNRHGVKENIPSFLVNYKANLYAFYKLGCTHIFATSICGSLQEELCTGEFVIFDQFIDLSKHKELSFSDKISLDTLNHSAFNKPFSDDIRDSFIQAAVVNGTTVHTKGTVVAVDGPRQSTRAESNLYRSWGGDVINTSTVPEAILAHELNIAYGAISLCAYYDTWRTDIHPATRTEKLEIQERNSTNYATIVTNSINYLSED